MVRLTSLLAQAGGRLPALQDQMTKTDTASLKAILRVVGLGLLGVAVLFAVAYLLWRRHARRHAHRGEILDTAAPEPGASQGHHHHHHHRHRHRRRHRRHRESRRNPTLQETGGLPPPRPEGEAPQV